MKITEIDNELPNIKPVKEIMNIYIDGIDPNLPNRNGFIYALIGSPGTGKSSLLLSLFRDRNYYKKKFNNLYLITPENSFTSVVNHPFKNHTKVFHDLNEDVLENIYEELMDLKRDCLDDGYEMETSCLIIDDFAADLKDKEIIKILKRILTKSRHIGCSIIFTLQAYNLFPLVLRKMLTNITLFKPKNKVELDSVRKELINLNEEKTTELMNYVFDEEYNHLDVDTTNSSLQKNFKLLEINTE
jgi:ABC-type dipeptide/oligopeptide/nickel transport system ATPase component